MDLTVTVESSQFQFLVPAGFSTMDWSVYPVSNPDPSSSDCADVTEENRVGRMKRKH